MPNPDLRWGFVAGKLYLAEEFALFDQIGYILHEGVPGENQFFGIKRAFGCQLVILPGRAFGGFLQISRAVPVFDEPAEQGVKGSLRDFDVLRYRFCQLISVTVVFLNEHEHA
jgi:hypothetical protein